MRIKCLGTLPYRRNPVIVPELNYRKFEAGMVYELSELESHEVLSKYGKVFSKMEELDLFGMEEKPAAIPTMDRMVRKNVRVKNGS